MESGSATTRALRSRISCERGPGTAVRSSMLFVVAISTEDNAAAGRSAYLYRGFSEGLRRERLDRVEARGIPEHEALHMLEPGGLDLVLDVGEPVSATHREVLEPRYEHRLPARQLRAKVAERIRDRRA